MHRYCNDIEALGLAFHQGPIFTNAYYQTWLIKTDLEMEVSTLEITACVFASLAKEGYIFASVGLSVCQFVDNTTQKVMDGLGWNFMEGSWVVQ